MKRRRYGLINLYVGREYVLSFFISFSFFFFIFFVNQILVLAQKILLKNVSVRDVLLLVCYSIPQFLMYTMPFSSLASASMVIGNFSSQNEILALRSCGVNIKRIFKPIVAISLVFSVCTMLIANSLIPYTTSRYRDLYADVLERVPTLELTSYSSTQFNGIVISNGPVSGNTLYDVIIFDDTDSRSSRIVSASQASIEVVDIDRFLYRIDLVDPRIMITDHQTLESYSSASAQSMSMYLDLSSSGGVYTSISPSQMSISQLLDAAGERKSEDEMFRSQRSRSLMEGYASMGESLYEMDDGKAVRASDIALEARRIDSLESSASFSFYYQYYRSELNKKFALSTACTILVFIAFPISFFRVKNGRLIGFGLSMLIACIYWFFLFYMHSTAISSSLNPAFYLWLPNAVMLLAGLVLLWKLRRK